jgi:hypothetical protein
MAHAQKPDLVSQRNGRVHLNRHGRQFSRLLAAELCAWAVVMLDTPKFRGSVKHRLGTGYPLHSPVSSSLPLPCVTVCHHVSTGVYLPACHSKLLCSFLSLVKIAFPSCTGYRPNLQRSSSYEFVTATNWFLTPQKKLGSLCYSGIRQQQTRKCPPFCNNKVTTVRVFEVTTL